MWVLMPSPLAPTQWGKVSRSATGGGEGDNKVATLPGFLLIHHQRWGVIAPLAPSHSSTVQKHSSMTTKFLFVGMITICFPLGHPHLPHPTSPHLPLASKVWLKQESKIHTIGEGEEGEAQRWSRAILPLPPRIRSPTSLESGARARPPPTTYRGTTQSLAAWGGKRMERTPGRLVLLAALLWQCCRAQQRGESPPPTRSNHLLPPPGECQMSPLVDTLICGCTAGVIYGTAELKPMPMSHNCEPAVSPVIKLISQQSPKLIRGQWRYIVFKLFIYQSVPTSTQNPCSWQLCCTSMRAETFVWQ